MATSDQDALGDVILGRICNVSNLPDWMRAPALGRSMRPLANLIAGAVLASDWLAQRDLRVRAEALREAADEVTEDGGAWDVLALYVDEAGHPYALEGIRRWLRERADRIEASG